MSVVTATETVTDPVRQRRTLLVGTRLFLAANTMMMGALLFAFLYLRSINNAGMWRPDGIDSLSGVGMAIMLVLQLACLLAVLAAIGAVRRGVRVRPIVALAVLLGLGAGVVRVWYQYHLGAGWVINNGTYTATTELWFGILIVEILVGVLCLFSIALSRPTATETGHLATQLRAFAEFWGYMLGLSTFVFLLVRLV